jgi:4-hydroxybenzoate polyprenyltransferase
MNHQQSSPLSTARAYLELVRLPNLFTAMADVTMGFLVTHPIGDIEWETLDTVFWAMLVAASTLAYAAGVVLNDLFDLELDARERPERPLPSGRISVRAARRLGGFLLTAAVVLGATAAALAGDARPAIVILTLASCIVFYDAFLKPTFVGPVAMGACRMLNVLLGMSLLSAGPGRPLAWPAVAWLIAAAVGVYVMGVTWLARGEAGRSDRWRLLLATAVILGGMALLLPVPQWLEYPALLLKRQPQRWWIMLGVLGVYTGGWCLQAAADPEPDRVQGAVKHCLMALVVLDAAAAYAASGLTGALIVLAFLFPATLAGTWFRST